MESLREPKEVEFEKPKGLKQDSVEPEIYVMPEKFRGVTREAKIPKFSAPVPPSQPSAPKMAAASSKPQKKFPWFWVGLIFIILLALGASIFFVLQGMRGEAPAPAAEEKVVQQPAQPAREPEPEEEVEIPVATSEEVLPATTEVTIPVEIPEEEEVATPEVSVPTRPVELIGGVDADSDGLTDVEEELFATNSAKPDTDDDGYLDGNEVYHLYNPGGTAPVTLLEAGLVRSFVSESYKYEIYRPAPWTIGGDDPEAVQFLIPAGGFVQVLVEQNPQGLNLKDWYLALAPGVDQDELKEFKNKAGLDGLQSPDRLTAYFQKDSLIFVINLELGGEMVIEYRRTYEMILNSFKFLE